MKADVINFKKAKVGQVELADAVFNAETNASTIYEAVKNILGNKRQGTASTLTRGTVSGTTRKPWKQKGTGRARAGSFKSPLWRGKGIIFGPHPRSYRNEIPRKVKENAFVSVYSEFQKAGKLIILDDIKPESAKTKALAASLKAVSGAKRVLWILSGVDKDAYAKIRRAAKNISWLRAVNSQSVEIKDLYYADDLVISKSAVGEIQARYA